MSPGMSTLLQFGLLGLAVLLIILTLISSLIIQWSLLPILPSSVIEIILSGQLVIIRSSMLPFTWVGKSTSWARSSSSNVSRTFLTLAVELSSDQLISGKLTSPMTIEFLSSLLNKSHKFSMFRVPEDGGLYTSIIFSGGPFVSTLKPQNWLNSLSLNLSLGKILVPVFTYTNSPPPMPFVVSVRSLRRSVTISYIGIDRAASGMVWLHQVSVSKIISGSRSATWTINSFILD